MAILPRCYRTLSYQRAALRQMARWGGQNPASAAASGIEQVDRGVDTRLDFLARKAGFDRLAEMQGDRAGPLPPPMVEPPAVNRHRHDLQTQHLVQPGKARLQRGPGAVGHAGSLREDRHRAAAAAVRTRLR